MKYIKLHLTKHGNYFFKEGEDLQLFILANYLATDCSLSYVQSWRDLILTNEQTYCSGIETFVSWDNENVELSDVYDNSGISENFITIPKQEFFAILDRWEELVKQQPDEIIITQDDAGKISITGKFADGKEI